MEENTLKETGRVDPLKGSEIITMKKLTDCKASDEEQLQSVLADFQSLDFENNLCDNPADVINYSDGQEVNPFNKISKYYRKNKNIFLFISVLRDEEQRIKIEDLVSQKCDDVEKAKFLRRMYIYLD